jgi:nicotinate-nucleotide adenylyltransferase
VNNSRRTGILGGTFDPIHKGHLAIARAALEQAALDKILFVVAANPPHKINNSLTDVSLRLAMTEAAIADTPAFQISRVELDRKGYSYTADTLKTLHEEDPQSELFFIIGYDSALDLPRWREPGKILEQAALLIAPRPDCMEPLPEILHGHAALLHMEPCHISSSAIRRRIQEGKEVSDMLPAGVCEIIQRERLYQSCP